jgi:hypothetical protein
MYKFYLDDELVFTMKDRTYELWQTGEIENIDIPKFDEAIYCDEL